MDAYEVDEISRRMEEPTLHDVLYKRWEYNGSLILFVSLPPI